MASFTSLTPLVTAEKYRDIATALGDKVEVLPLKDAGHFDMLSPATPSGAVVEAAMDGGAICKVILETSLLTDDEKVRGCRAARRARADFVKTATGFGPGGATADDVALMSRAVSGTRMGVKASGGIRNLQDAEQMIRAGATHDRVAPARLVSSRRLGRPLSWSGRSDPRLVQFPYPIASTASGVSA